MKRAAQERRKTLTTWRRHQPKTKPIAPFMLSSTSWTVSTYARTPTIPAMARPGGTMIGTIANVADFEQFLRTFSNEGVEKRREHGCKGAYVVRDPDDGHRVWVFFDWAQEDYEGFLADPEIPGIARKLALREPPAVVEPVAQYEA